MTVCWPADVEWNFFWLFFNQKVMWWCRCRIIWWEDRWIWRCCVWSGRECWGRLRRFWSSCLVRADMMWVEECKVSVAALTSTSGLLHSSGPRASLLASFVWSHSHPPVLPAMQLQKDLLIAVLTVCLLQGTSRADKSPDSSNVIQVVDNNVISMTVEIVT